LENISRRGPQNRRSLGFARDDKGESGVSIESGCSDGAWSVTNFHGNVALPFVIPSEAEGSAVLKTSPGNVFNPGITAVRGKDGVGV
jgi:hypothetical protein